MIVWERGGESSRKGWPGDRSCAPYGFASSPPDSVAFLYGVTWVTSCDGMFLHHVTPCAAVFHVCTYSGDSFSDGANCKHATGQDSHPGLSKCAPGCLVQPSLPPLQQRLLPASSSGLAAKAHESS